MKTVTWVVAIALLCLVAACAPAAPTPTPTPEPRPTPVEVLATKPEHLAGLWTAVEYDRRLYIRFEPDGTMKWDYDVAEPTRAQERFWFEDGVYYEESSYCVPIGSYRAYLRIEEGRAVALRFEVIDDSDPSCLLRRERRFYRYLRVDR
jgi:hypothetical protein